MNPGPGTCPTCAGTGLSGRNLAGDGQPVDVVCWCRLSTLPSDAGVIVVGLLLEAPRWPPAGVGEGTDAGRDSASSPSPLACARRGGVSDLVGTVEQVAERLEISTWVVYRMCRAGKLPYWRLGGDIRGSIRIPWAALEDTLAEQAQVTAAARRATR